MRSQRGSARDRTARMIRPRDGDVNE